MSHYDTYAEHKGYTTPMVGPKHIRRMDREIWHPGGYSADMSVLEIGCGTGLVLAYLYEKGVRALVGVDHDERLAGVIPTTVKSCFKAADIWDYLSDARVKSANFDRIILFDVLEHFTPDDGRKLLNQLGGLLETGGRIHLKMPNAGSPWGQQFQYGDLTHLTAYTPESIRQQAVAAGLRCTQIYPQRLGSRNRRVLDAMVHGLLNRVLASPPEVWEGNIFALLEIPSEN